MTTVQEVPSHGSALKSNELYELAPATVKQEIVPVSPEFLQLQKLLDKFYGTKSTSDWEKSKRRILQSVSFHTFVGGTTSGVTLYILVSIWFMLFTHAKVIYTFPLNVTSPGALKTIDVKSPFLGEVKYGLEAFSYYSNGCIVMIIGGLCGFYTLTAPYQTRALRYFAISFIFLLSAIVLIVGPVYSLMAKNTEDETKLLDRDAGLAYDRSIQGSIHYFKNRQCDTIGRAVLGRDSKEADEMKAFCSLISRLVIIYHFMAFTAIVPILGAILCWLQIAINMKVWNAKSIRRAKARTKEQKQADMCATD